MTALHLATRQIVWWTSGLNLESQSRKIQCPVSCSCLKANSRGGVRDRGGPLLRLWIQLKQLDCVTEWSCPACVTTTQSLVLDPK